MHCKPSVLQVDVLPLTSSCHTEILDSSSTCSVGEDTSELSGSYSVTAPSLSPFTSEFDITEDEEETRRPPLTISSSSSLAPSEKGTSRLPSLCMQLFTSEQPSLQPVTSEQPSLQPVTSERPSLQPVTSQRPSLQPVTSERPSLQPVTSERPSLQPVTSEQPSPSLQPVTSEQPSLQPVTSERPLSSLFPPRQLTHCVVTASSCSEDTYGLMGDNLDTNIKSRYLRSNVDTRENSLHYFNCFAIKYRIPFNELPILPRHMCMNSPEKLAKQFLPSKDNDEAMKENFVMLVRRKITTHMAYFKFSCSDIVDWHKQHKYYQEMSIKSEVVC